MAVGLDLSGKSIDKCMTKSIFLVFYVSQKKRCCQCFVSDFSGLSLHFAYMQLTTKTDAVDYKTRRVLVEPPATTLPRTDSRNAIIAIRTLGKRTQ